MSDTNDMPNNFVSWVVSGNSNIPAGARWDSEIVQSHLSAWKAATERATALERERCARVCEINQVAHNVKQGHFLVNWPIESYGVHEGMTYAAAIRQGGAT